MTDEELIAELRRIGPLLLRRDGDDVARYGGGLLIRAADRHVIQRDALAAYARQNADVHRENLRLRDRIAELEALTAAQTTDEAG